MGSWLSQRFVQWSLGSSCGFQHLSGFFISEKKNCSRISRAMTDFYEFIDDMGLLDPHLVGGKYTWRKGNRHDIAARLNRFLVSYEWDEGF